MWFLSTLLIGLAASDDRLLSHGYSRSLTSMAATEYSLKLNDQLEHTVVYFPNYNDLSTHFINKLTSKLEKGEKLHDLESYTITCNWGDGPDYFRFAPQFKGAAFPGRGSTKFANHCYQKVTIEIASFNENSVEMTLSSWDPSGLCYDTYLISILNRAYTTYVDFFGTKKFTFANLTSSEVFDIQENGVRVFTFCDGIEELVSDVFMTVELFAGGFGKDPLIPVFGSHTTKYMEESNLKFLYQAMSGYTMEKRPIYKPVVSESEIHSGDFLAVVRLDGLDEIIMWGTGGRVGHSTMALWIEENGTRELYILESQAAWYWPRTGLQMNKFSNWIKWAENASFMVCLLPLKPEVREIFNETAVLDWFKTVEGTPYGFHNFIFGWIDTATQNLPPILSPELLTIGFSLVERVIPSAIASIYGLAMNKRLGTFGLTIPELQVVAGQQGKSLLDVQAEVEMDGWWYPDGYSYVCSSFVFELYKKAGIMGSLDIQGVEMTPKDVYSLSIFDTGAVLPEACVEADPGLPYCQLLGDYRVNLGPDYGSIAPYSHMDETCPSVAPDYVRPAGC